MKTSLRIFIAEDEAIILSSFRAAIEHMGHSVAGFALDGETAQKMIKEISPDLVLIDINLPKKTGIEVIRAVNQDTLIPCLCDPYRRLKLLDIHRLQQIPKRSCLCRIFNQHIRIITGNDNTRYQRILIDRPYYFNSRFFR